MVKLLEMVCGWFGCTGAERGCVDDVRRRAICLLWCGWRSASGSVPLEAHEVVSETRGRLVIHVPAGTVTGSFDDGASTKPPTAARAVKAVWIVVMFVCPAMERAPACGPNVFGTAMQITVAGELWPHNPALNYFRIMALFA